LWACDLQVAFEVLKARILEPLCEKWYFFIVGAKAAFNVSGTQSGYRFITAEVLQELPLRATGYEGELELLLKACKGGHSVVEILITTHYIIWKALKPFAVDEK
jgi:hypothetical protein